MQINIITKIVKIIAIIAPPILNYILKPLEGV
jgi:hypothetical protein